MTNAEARFNKSHIRKVYACLAVTCHLHFWQNDRDLLRATVVTRGWNGYRNKSQHRKSTLEKKILPPFQQGFEPATFQSRVRRSNHWAIPAPHSVDSTDHNFWRERRAEADSNRGPPAYQRLTWRPNGLTQSGDIRFSLIPRPRLVGDGVSR